MFYLAWPFCLAIFSLTWYSNTRVADQKFFLSCWLLKTYRVGTSQLTPVLFIYLKLEVYFWENNLWQFLIAVSFQSKLSCNSFSMHRRSNTESRTIKSQRLSCQRQWKQTCTSAPNWFDGIHDPKNGKEMRLVAPVTWGYYFSFGTLHFIDVDSLWTISID